MKKTIKNQKGFTIVEMIAVLIIISIIAAIVVPRFFDFDKSSTKVVERFEQKSNERVDFVNEMNEKMKGEK